MEMPRLPPELYNLILKNLNVNELLSCRLVCKLFKGLVDQIKIKSLAIFKEENAFSYKPSPYGPFAGEDYILQFHNETEHQAFACQTLKSSSLRTLNALNLSQLRQLIINRIEIRGRSGFEAINRLDQLEYLEISLFHLYCNLEITLPNLRTFKTHDSVGPTNYQLRLSTPSLTTLQTVCFQTCTQMGPNKLKFSRPETLKRLIVRDCDRNMVENFRNLEYFECHSGHFFGYLELSRFRAMKALNCGELTVNDAVRILEQRKNWKMNFDLFYRGLKMNRSNELNEELVTELTNELTVPNSNTMWRRFRRFSTDRLLANYSDLVDTALPLAREMNYEDYVEYFPNGPPESFSTRFFNVRQLNCSSRVENPSHFVQMIQNFKHLETVRLINTGLTDDFYIRHLHLFSRITELHIFDQPNTLVDLEIILKFKKLEKFRTNQQVCHRLILSLFQKLDRFSFVHFAIEEQTYEIDFGDRLKPADTIQVRMNDYETESLAKSEILNFLESIFEP